MGSEGTDWSKYQHALAQNNMEQKLATRSGFAQPTPE